MYCMITENKTVLFCKKTKEAKYKSNLQRNLT